MAAVRDSEGLISMLDGAAVVSAVERTTIDEITEDDDLTDMLDAVAPRKLTEADWRDDPVPVKLEKIRAAFLNSKSAAEVIAAAENMPISMWLECVIKLMPKDIKVQGEVSFRHMLEGLGPIDKDAYRLPTVNRPQIVQAEYSEA